jgi:uncharacterized protein
VRIAVIADTHLPRGTRRLPPKCLEELARAELILHAGDFVAPSVLDELGALAPVEAVYGNMDDAALQASLPRERVVEAGGVRIGMLHIPGPRAGRAKRLVEAFAGCQAVVYGHTHEPELTAAGGMLLLNPGSPTERRRAATRSMLVLETREKDLEAGFIALP